MKNKSSVLKKSSVKIYKYFISYLKARTVALIPKRSRGTNSTLIDGKNAVSNKSYEP